MAETKKGVSGTREWSSSSVNCMSGCSNGCWYCYARATASGRTKTKDTEDWTNEKPIPDKIHKRFGKREGTVMFPTQHDLTLGNMKYTIAVLQSLLRVGNRVLVVSKPHPAVIEQLTRAVEGYEDQILFRFTIGSIDPSVLGMWEPFAPTVAERIFCLVYAERAGFKTSVSMEPLLCPDIPSTIQAVDTFYPYITDAIWIGKMNHAAARLKINKAPPAAINAANFLEGAWNDDAIHELYRRLKDHSLVKWKESIKKIVGIEVPTEAGLDI
jgi:DNA repair photolyase